MKQKCAIPSCRNQTKAKSGLCKPCAQLRKKLPHKREARVSRHFRNTNHYPKKWC